MNKDVRRWARSCVQCQQAKIHSHTSSPLSTFETPDARFDRVHLDLVGPYSIDRYTRWPEALPIPNITAETAASHFVSGWISRSGVPSTVMTKRGKQFECALWTSLMQLLGSTRLRTMAYHPSSNGMIERFHRQLKAAINPSPDRWTEVLPMVLLGIRTCLKSDLGCSTAELVYGTTLKLPSDFFITPTPNRIPDPSSYVDRIKSGMQSLKPTPPREQLRHSHVPADLVSCTHVFLRHDGHHKPLQPPYHGPYKVCKHMDKHFTVDVKGKSALHRLKPAYLDELPTPQPHPLSTTHTCCKLAK